LPEDFARQKVKSATGKNRVRRETAAEWRTRMGKRWNEVEAWREDRRWHPHQLRHTCATKLRKRFGLEAARVVLRHKSSAVAEVYAEIDMTKAEKIMGEVG
jgi:integrase